MVSDVATKIRDSAAGLDPGNLTVTLTPSQGSAITDTLANLISGSTYATTSWPPSSPSGANAIGQPVTISVQYPFNSGISMFWPGSKPTDPLGRICLPASSTDLIQF
jgi:hypothetical protein